MDSYCGTEHRVHPVTGELYEVELYWSDRKNDFIVLWIRPVEPAPTD